ncbi:MAG: hypothetical protein A4E53_00628 [Pelotomaculum sp. PtaB.Bin104]|nr:MAG: hypothetical protein A4E53_00628 [Pelotomaculum sp. PtaB.Bin104]
MPRKQRCDCCGRMITVQTRKGKRICTHCRSRIVEAEKVGLTFEQAQPIIAEAAKTAKVGAGGKIDWKEIKKAINPIPKRANNGFARTMADKIEISLRDYPIERAKYNSLDNETKGKIIKDLRDMLFDAMREGLV